MGTTIAVCSQKGGVGKTTTVLNLGYALSQLGHRTVMIDLDPQGALLLALAQPDRERPGISDVLAGTIAAKEAVINTSEPNLSLVGFGTIPSAQVAHFEREVATPDKVKQALRELAEPFAYALIDCAPGLGGLTYQTLAAVNQALVVKRCEPLSLRSIPQILELIDSLRSSLNEELALSGILLTQYSVRNKVAGQVAQQVWETFPPEAVFQTVIPEHALFLESTLHGVPLGRMGRAAAGLAARYVELAHEIILGGAGQPLKSTDDEIRPLL